MLSCEADCSLSSRVTPFSRFSVTYHRVTSDHGQASKQCAAQSRTATSKPKSIFNPNWVNPLEETIKGNSPRKWARACVLFEAGIKAAFAARSSPSILPSFSLPFPIALGAARGELPGASSGFRRAIGPLPPPPPPPPVGVAAAIAVLTAVGCPRGVTVESSLRFFRFHPWPVVRGRDSRSFEIAGRACVVGNFALDLRK
ncbi:hypothetical protein NL676_001371 [Syzygium grande]|nr:hypothetical protein NL676_001371 [Syzygium grande]